jgi:cell wall-associated NlpC family hydrolase
VFFYSDVSHVGIYIGNGQFVHAPRTGDVVKISPLAGRNFIGGARP